MITIGGFMGKISKILFSFIIFASICVFSATKHQISVDGLTFDSWNSYLTSDYFKNANKKCLIKTIETNKQFKIASDCTKTSTTINNQYYPTSYYTIPVVFHVIYASDGTGNIDDSFIYSQIDILNEDYGAFSGTLGAPGFDTHIKFTLAGITRTENDNWFNDNDESGYKSSLGWDQNSYLNIYVNSAHGYLGYSYMPQDAAGSTLDGIVVVYAAVGRNSPNGVYNLGRTLTHEIGHYFGLFHTFSPNEGSASGTCVNSYTEGDFIMDTNSEDDEHYGCSETSTCGTQDPIHNYMNYTDDACMNNFTQEQANRMICCLFSYRPALYTEVSAGAPFIISFTSSATSGLIPLTVTFNTSALDPDGGNIVSYLWDFDNDGLADSVTSTNYSSHTYSSEGIYYSKVTVVDDEGDSTTSSAISISVSEKLPPEITVFSANPTSGTAPLNVSFQVTANDPDGGNITDYSFDFQSDQTIDKTGVSNIADYQYSTPGNYTAKVIVTDDEGTKSFSNVTVTVNDNEPPIITNFSASTTLGIIPLVVTFTVHSSDPGGGEIINYQWDFDNDGIFDETTSSGSVTKTYLNQGVYSVKVKVTDDDGDSTYSQLLNIFANKIAPTFIPGLNSINLKKEPVETKSFLLNPGTAIANISLTAMKNNGTVVKTLQKTLNPSQKDEIDSSDFSAYSYDEIKVSADQKIIIYSTIKFSTGKMATYLLQNLSSHLIITHIAEEINDWETTAFVSNDKSFLTKINVNSEQTSIGSENTYNINLENFLTNGITEQKTWGIFSAYPPNPFQDSKSLNGFEMFVKNNNDGAAVELSPNPSKQLFIPHIPIETDIFWTGFSIVNDNNVQTQLSISLYSSSGTLVGLSEKTIGAGEKLKGTVDQLFPNLAGTAEWGIINSTQPISGAEIYGTYNAGICGFLLPTNSRTNSYLPDLEYSTENWTGIAISNPSATNAEIIVKLLNKEGIVKGHSEVNIAGFNKYSVVVSQLFSELAIETGDFINITSDIGVVAIEASGDLNRSWMTALTGK